MTQDNYCIPCGQVSEIRFSDNFRGVFIGGNLVAVWTSSLRSGGYASLRPWVQQWSLRRWCLRRWCFLSWDTNFRHESSKSFGRWCVAWKREEKMVNFSSKHAGFLSFPVVLMSTIRTFFGAIFLSNCPKFFPNKSGVIKQVTPPKFKQTTISWFFFFVKTSRRVKRWAELSSSKDFQWLISSGSSARQNSASTSDNGDKISSQIVQIRVFCRVCRCRQVKIHQEKKKTSPSFSFKFQSTIQKLCQFIGQNPVKSEQSVSRSVRSVSSSSEAAPWDKLGSDKLQVHCLYNL